MKPVFIICFSIFLLGACKEAPQPVPNDLIIGEWALISRENPEGVWDKNFVFITKDNKFWKFTLWENNYIIDSCLTVKDNKVFDGSNEKYTLQLKDSSTLTITNELGESREYRNSDRERESNYIESLKDFIKRDSMHKFAIGWWKLTDAFYKPIKLPNYQYVLNNFTLHLAKNGDATFYIDHRLDSMIKYTWKGEAEGISLARGDVSSGVQFHEFSDRFAKITLDRWQEDTFSITRCHPLIKRQ